VEQAEREWRDLYWKGAVKQLNGKFRKA